MLCRGRECIHCKPLNGNYGAPACHYSLDVPGVNTRGCSVEECTHWQDESYNYKKPLILAQSSPKNEYEEYIKSMHGRRCAI